MKKLSLILSGLLILSLAFTSCSTGSGDKSGTGENGGNGGGSQGTTTKKVTVYTIDAATTTALDGHSWYIASISLQEFANKTVNVSFEADMKTENSGSAASLAWTINAVDAKGDAAYPNIASKEFPAGTSEWLNVTGTGSDIILSAYPVIFINPYGITPANFKIYLKNIKITVTEAADSTNTKTYTEMATGDGITKTTVTESGSDSGSGSGSGDGDDITRENYNWLSAEVPSLLETYRDQFEYIGIAAEYGNFGLQQNGSNRFTATYTHSGWGTPSELYYEEIQNGIKKHANSITLGNELKPQFLLQWWDGDGSKQEMVDYTGSNGKSIKVPKSLNGEKLIYATLNVCKAMGVQMRGHVLTWHSQTPDGFFAEGYKPTYDENNSALMTNLVDKETMTARHEWYIKTVLDCVGAWETANNYKAIWAWDVVNESMADDAGKTYTGTSQNWLRGSTAETKDKSPAKGGSRWYQIYGNEEFIINAFKFAVAHGPDDIKLCYNDYNEYWDADGHYKTSAIEHIAGLIKDALIEIGNDDEDRFVIAMQSHVGTSWPGVSGYESALKRFLEIADVHVSELDFSAETQAAGTKAYGDYFKMLQKYGNDSSDTHRITNVTIWGINNESSWINPAKTGGKKTYPLLFNLVNNVNTNVKEVTYDTGDETLPQYDVGDSYITNDAFWAVINAHK